MPEVSDERVRDGELIQRVYMGACGFDRPVQLFGRVTSADVRRVCEVARRVLALEAKIAEDTYWRDGDLAMRCDQAALTLEQATKQLTAAEARLVQEQNTAKGLGIALGEALSQRDRAVAMAEAALGMLDANDPDALWTDEAEKIKAELATLSGEG